MRNTLAAAILPVLMIVSMPALAGKKSAADSYAFDKVHTQIMFSVSHLGFSFSTGSFTAFDGGFTFDEAKPENSSVNVTIDTDSISLHDDKWEEHMKSEDFFNVAVFPTMTFKSTLAEKTGDNTARLTGDLTLLGVTRPVTLDVIFNKAAVHPYSKQYVAGFSATGTLKRSDFGMVYGLPGIGDEVNITLEVEGIRHEAAAPAPAKKP